MLRAILIGLLAAGSSAHVLAQAQQHPLATAQVSEVTYWTTAYTGDDLTSGKFGCAKPLIPALSTTNDDIRKTEQNIAAWEACYNGFVSNFNDAQPPGKRIPAEVAKKMTPAEMNAAQNRMAAVYEQVIAAAQADAQSITEQREAWRKATEAHVVEMNTANERKKKMRQQDLLNDIRRTSEDIHMQSGPGRSGGATK